MQQDPSEKTCRICRSDEEPLYNPCICSGSIKHVHRECLIRWIKEGRQNKRWCELCGYEFEFVAPLDSSSSNSPHHQAGSSFNFTRNEESIQAFLEKALDFLLIGLGALAIALPNFVFFHLVYPMGFLIQIFCSSSSSLFPHILLKCLFVCEFMYSLHFELGADHQVPFVEIISLKPAQRTFRKIIWDLAKISFLLCISVHFGVVFPFFLGNYLKRAIGSLFIFPLSLLPLDVDSVFIGQTGMFSIYTCLRFMLQFGGNFGHRFVGFVESLCFFKIALMIFFCFYASFGFIADIISFPLSHGSISMRFYSGDSNPMSVGVLYFLIGSEIIHFMSNPMVISHFRKGVLFFRPLNPNGTFSVANIYSVPFLLLFIYVFSCTIRKLFPTYGPVRFLSVRNGDSSIRGMLDEIALMILLRKIRLGEYKPFSTTLFTKFSAWSVKRIASCFRLSSYLYGGRFPNEERAIAGRFRWVPKRNEFYQPEQLSIRQNTPVTLLDMKMKKILLPHESSSSILLSSTIGTSNAREVERSPPNVHASYDICFVPENFLVRLYSFCFTSMTVVMVFFSMFLVLSIGIGWRLLERFDFAYQSDFFAYFFGRAILKFLMIPIYYFAFLKSSTSPSGGLEIINFASIANFFIYSIIAPVLFYKYLSSFNPFNFPKSIIIINSNSPSQSKDSNAFHSTLSTLIFLSCFLSGKLLKETNLMLKRQRFSPVPFVKFSLKLMLAFTGKWILSKLDFLQDDDASFYALTFKMTFIALHCWRSLKTANKEASKEQIENLELQNYSDPFATTTTNSVLEIPTASSTTASSQRLKQD